MKADRIIEAVDTTPIRPHFHLFNKLKGIPARIS